MGSDSEWFDSEWVSRQIAAMARHPERRHPLIRLDWHGGMNFEDIMKHWGDSQYLRRRDVIRAVMEHYFHADAPESLRW